ncbi:hypothetical protein NMY22_g1175 [Coprinellus aureogranulatus]|nr:hypothetical protein NMY22_g1175 [Coprinellus aureogranulatus]
MAILPEGCTSEKSELAGTSGQSGNGQNYGRSPSRYASPREDPSAVGRWSRSVLSSLESLFGTAAGTTPPAAAPRSAHSALAASSLPHSSTPASGSALFSGAHGVNSSSLFPASQLHPSPPLTVTPSIVTGQPALPHSPPPSYSLSLDNSLTTPIPTHNTQGPYEVTSQHPTAQTFLGRAVQIASRNLMLRRLIDQLTAFVSEIAPSAGVSGSGTATLPVASGSIILPHGEYVLVPRQFAALLLPLEVINKVLHKTKDIFPDCLLSVEESADPVCVRKDEQGVVTVRYELRLGCQAHTAGACPIPWTPLVFEVGLPAPSSAMDQHFIDVLTEAMYDSVVTSAQSQFRAGPSSSA